MKKSELRQIIREEVQRLREENEAIVVMDQAKKTMFKAKALIEPLAKRINKLPGDTMGGKDASVKVDIWNRGFEVKARLMGPSFKIVSKLMSAERVGEKLTSTATQALANFEKALQALERVNAQAGPFLDDYIADGKSGSIEYSVPSPGVRFGYTSKRIVCKNMLDVRNAMRTIDSEIIKGVKDTVKLANTAMDTIERESAKYE